MARCFRLSSWCTKAASNQISLQQIQICDISDVGNNPQSHSALAGEQCFFFCVDLRCSECKVNISAQERSARCENSLGTGNALTLRDCVTVERYCIQTAEPNPAYEWYILSTSLNGRILGRILVGRINTTIYLTFEIMLSSASGVTKR